MINNHSSERISRSVSQNVHSEQSLACLRDQSSCSSLTSGIGQSDQSLSNDRVSALDQEIADPHNNVSPVDEQSSAAKSQLQPTISGNERVSNHTPQYLRCPPSKSTSAHDNTFVGEPSSLTLELIGSDANKGGTQALSRLDDAGREQLKTNIKQFVDIIFTDSQSISLEKKAEFGQLMRTHEARLLFAMFVDDYRVNSKKVSELTFYSLAQYFSIILLECLLAEDFRPAKIIMNMMFTYYYEQSIDKIPPRERSLVLSQDLMANKKVNSYESEIDKSTNIDGQEAGSEPKTIKNYLYNLLKDQEIFKSIRFWTSAFYESVIIERNNHPVFVDKQRGKLSNEKRDEELDCSKNITFGLLGSFIHNMCLLDLSHEFCQEFLDKHSTIAGLSDCQLEMLRANLQAMFKDSSDKVPMSQTTAGERLSMFVQKWSTRLNQSNQSSALGSSQAQQKSRQ